MVLYFVCYGKVGSWERFDGFDDQRFLIVNGRVQVDVLVERFRDQFVFWVLSSLYVRCVQTVESLVRAVGVLVEPVDALVEGWLFELVFELLAGLVDGCVLCIYGDVLFDVLAVLEWWGVVIEELHDFCKGVMWVFERDFFGICCAFAVVFGVMVF